MQERAPSILKPYLKSVVLAEDSRQDCELFMTAFKQAGKGKMSTVKNGIELMDLLNYFIPDLLFMDLNMPHKNGVECLKEIRENKIYDDMPIVVYTATSGQSNVQALYGLGCQLYVVKPTSVDELSGCLRKILKLDWKQPHVQRQKFFLNDSFVPFAM